MVEGYLHPPNESNWKLEDIGDQYFDDLLSISLFQDIERNEIGDVESCTMHDVVHDLALFVSGGESLIWDQIGFIVENSKIRHLRVKSNGEVLSKGVSQKLHSLFLDADNEAVEIALDLKSLRSLMLRACSEDILISLGKMKHLRYLDISSSEIKVLPKPFSKLYNLQTLKLMDCGLDLLKVPDDMKNLVSLRHLYFNDEKHMPKEIGHLTSVQTLPLFVVGAKNGYRIEELGCLSQLRGELHIQKLEDVGSKVEASKAKLKEKKKLQGLKFSWSTERKANNNINDEEVLEDLQPHPYLKSLVIWFYQRKNFPSWMQGGVNSSLNNLMKLELWCCNEQLYLPSLGLLRNLQFLKIWQMKKVKSMGSKFYMDQSNSDDGVGSATQFPALREFSVEEMESLEEWVEVEGVTVFPCLEKLNIEDCSKLKTWSVGGFSSNHKLSSLRISRCHKLMAIPSMDRLPSLQELKIFECRKLSSIPSVNGLTSLIRLMLYNCDELTGLPIRLGCCTSLKELRIQYCHNIISITEDIGELHFLSLLEICICGKLKSIPEQCVGRLFYLKCLSIGGFWSELEEFPGLTSIHQLHASTSALSEWLGDLSSLHNLWILHCSNLTHLPSIEAMRRLSNLQSLAIERCPKLEEKCIKESGPEWAKISHIPNITINGIPAAAIRIRE